MLVAQVRRINVFVLVRMFAVGQKEKKAGRENFSALSEEKQNSKKKKKNQAEKYSVSNECVG